MSSEYTQPSISHFELLKNVASVACTSLLRTIAGMSSWTNSFCIELMRKGTHSARSIIRFDIFSHSKLQYKKVNFNCFDDDDNYAEFDFFDAISSTSFIAADDSACRF